MNCVTTKMYYPSKRSYDTAFMQCPDEETHHLSKRHHCNTSSIHCSSSETHCFDELDYEPLPLSLASNADADVLADDMHAVLTFWTGATRCESSNTDAPYTTCLDSNVPELWDAEKQAAGKTVVDSPMLACADASRACKSLPVATQSLGDKAYEVFMQAWHIDELLYEVITEQTHMMKDLLWCHKEDKEIFQLDPDNYRREVAEYLEHGCSKECKEANHEDCFRYTFDCDPDSSDGWTDEARYERELYERTIATCTRRLADTRHAIAPAVLDATGRPKIVSCSTSEDFLIALLWEHASLSLTPKIFRV